MASLPEPNAGTDSVDANWVAKILAALPREFEPARRMVDICREAGVAEQNLVAVARAIVDLVKPFGFIEVDEGPDGPRVRAVSSHGSYFAASWSAYIREGEPILANWGRPASADGPYLAHDVLHGSQLLYLIERQRIGEKENPIPLREATVVQVVLKAKTRGRRGASYLMQYDQEAQQFQFIGGHVRTSDSSARVAATRELAEELPANRFSFMPSGDDLVEIGSSELTGLSRAYGVATRYHFTFFHLRTRQRTIALGPADRWVSAKEIASGQTRSGDRITRESVILADSLVGGGLRSLPLSCDDVQKLPLRMVLSERRWEIVGLILAVIGIAISMVPLVK
ncbi:NUDIX domain-containing protein [Actinoplanes sp. NEAU-A12]|uniref:NUDIX domain-containing protein n=1 Tax=Actinoplanes sandaracinus TaxID=3045177 RepID=A0ABT6WGB3_9ACTN|nr:NUDIX domain-containing protein [Actinoplanes sandaracinus]MDI6098768.1 NUDIX domain-containing protein [Actinoplanes sandaracinus]